MYGFEHFHNLIIKFLFADVEHEWKKAMENCGITIKKKLLIDFLIWFFTYCVKKQLLIDFCLLN